MRLTLIVLTALLSLAYRPASAYERCSWQNRDGRIVLVCCDTETGRCRVTSSR
jgi:hypothetical protein